MKKTILSILLATALCACAGNSNRQPAETAAATTEEKTDSASAEPSQEDGQSAPDFTLNDINGNSLSLSSLRGKYVVLDFWGLMVRMVH